MVMAVDSCGQSQAHSAGVFSAPRTWKHEGIVKVAGPWGEDTPAQRRERRLRAERAAPWRPVLGPE